MKALHAQIFSILKNSYPHLKTELHYENHYQLLVAVILSAQCTDKRVNIITPDLFKRFPNFASLNKAAIQDIENLIKTCGLFKAKSRYLQQTARIITEKFAGKVPSERKDLELLSGVGRKTANVILSVAFGIPAFPVDTHVARLSHRFGWSTAKNPLQIEKDVQKLFVPSEWHDLHHAMILHGRNICTARNPKCPSCPLDTICPKIFYR